MDDYLDDTFDIVGHLLHYSPNLLIVICTMLKHNVNLLFKPMVGTTIRTSDYSGVERGGDEHERMFTHHYSILLVIFYTIVRTS